jgi:anti-anti-sigma regulatory factor
MIRITVYEFTGRHADNQKIARRIAGKIRGAVRKGTCVLVDCDDVETFSPAFLAALMATAREDKVKFCGLPISEQIKMRSRRNGGRK